MAKDIIPSSFREKHRMRLWNKNHKDHFHWKIWVSWSHGFIFLIFNFYVYSRKLRNFNEDSGKKLFKSSLRESIIFRYLFMHIQIRSCENILEEDNSSFAQASVLSGWWTLQHQSGQQAYWPVQVLVPSLLAAALGQLLLFTHCHMTVFPFEQLTSVCKFDFSPAPGCGENLGREG